MRLSWDGLYTLCQVNLVEIKFTRRLKFAGRPASRRMLATLDGQLLNSKEGMEILNFKPPMKSPAYDAKSKGLLTVWDLLFQDWRNIPVSNCDVIATVSSRPPDKFWEYFNKVIGKMSAAQKAAFVDR